MKWIYLDHNATTPIPAQVQVSITDETLLITVMHANNKIGTIPARPRDRGNREREGGNFHTDAVQSVGKIPVDVQALYHTVSFPAYDRIVLRRTYAGYYGGIALLEDVLSKASRPF